MGQRKAQSAAPDSTVYVNGSQSLLSHMTPHSLQGGPSLFSQPASFFLSSSFIQLPIHHHLAKYHLVSFLLLSSYLPTA